MRLKKIIPLFLSFIFAFVLVVPALAVSLLPAECTSPTGCTLCNFLDLFINAANILVALSGTFSILMFVLGGILMITAYGNDARIKLGKDVLVATVTGICIVLLAWTMVNVIIGSLFGGKKVPDWADLSKGGVECPPPKQ